MTKACVNLAILLFCLATIAPASPPPSLLIDDFEDGKYTEQPEWFVFDNVKPQLVVNSRLKDGDSQVLGRAGQYSLLVEGEAQDWYAGGLGTALWLDATSYNLLQFDVYGYGEKSGAIKIELYDDDNNNKEIEVNEAWKPTCDDLFTTEFQVNWIGWKHISLPIQEFTVEGRGNKVYDPNLNNGSCGLAKIQIICLANTQSGKVKYNLDNLKFSYDQTLIN